MSSNTVKQKCTKCGVVFDRSKFNPYLDKCEKHREKKVSKNKPKIKKEKKEETISQVVLPIPTVQFKKVVVTIEKEKIFLHLLGCGWKLSSSNKLYKRTDKVNVVATLGSDGSPSQKFSVSHWGGDKFSGFDGSMSIVDKTQLKKLPTEITDDLHPIIDYIWPSEVPDEKESK